MMVLYGSDHIIVTRLGQAGFKHVTGGLKVTVNDGNFWPFSQCFGSAFFNADPDPSQTLSSQKVRF
jgi:hypothetical protein